MPTDLPTAAAPAIPLARWADRQLETLSSRFGLPRLSGQQLVGERGSNGRYTIRGRVSAGPGSSRLLKTCDGGWFALTLIRDVDRELLPALFGDAGVKACDWRSIAAAAARHSARALVSTGRLLGLPVAQWNEHPVSPAVETMVLGRHRKRTIGHRPLVVDLSAIWAGPLVGHLLWQAGMEVVKVESRSRQDLIRADDPATFARINQGKASLLVDFSDDEEKAALIRLIRRADVVIESSRPRALQQLGIDAEALVRGTAGLVWLSVTGHGARGEAANWTGIGNDCGVAGGLTRAMAEAGGGIGYVGDAIADPLTGIIGAREVLAAYGDGFARRIGLSMSAVVAMALAEERAYDRQRIDAELRAWGTAVGSPFPHVEPRSLTAAVRTVGADNARYLGTEAPC